VSGLTYRGFGRRPRPEGIPPLRHGWAPADPIPLQPLVAKITAAFREPFVGVTTDGQVDPALPVLGRHDGDTRRVRHAGVRFLDAFDENALGRVRYPLDAPEWRIWTNAFPSWPTHGVLLDDMPLYQRDLAMQVIRASLSPRGYDDVRTVMQLNKLLGRLIDDYHDTLDEFVYWFSVFGDPRTDGPWGWQLVGHHLDLHCAVVGDQMVFTPTFLGAEASHVESGGDQVRMFETEQSTGSALYEALSSGQRRQAVLCDSMLARNLPDYLKDPLDGRQRGGPGRDNAIVPYEGVRVAGFDARQRHLLLRVVDTYIGREGEGHAQAAMRDIEQRLDDTWFAWVGDGVPGHPFYYKVQSPVIMIEFDHHSGVFLDNDEPQPFHVHTIVRTPNGGDYGRDLLRQHYAHEHAAARPGVS
jgi:hypothetical protein